MTLLPLCVAAAAFIVAVPLPARDPDMWWYLATGRWMIDHGELLRVDIFSSTATGRSIRADEWIGQIALAAVHGAFGWTGLAVLRALLVAASAFFLTRVALRAADTATGLTSDLRRAIALVLVAAALALSSILWTDRPQLVSLALFPLLLDLLFAARAGSHRSLYAVPPLLFIWSDLHSGYAIGLLLTALFAIESAVMRRDAARFALIAAVTFAAVLLNPGAVAVLPATGDITSAPRLIGEGSPPDVLTPSGALFAAFAVAVLASFLLRGGSLLGALLLIPLVWLGFSAQRHIVWFAFASLPFLTEAAIATWDWYGHREGVSRPGRGEDAISGARVEGPRPLNDGQHRVAGGEANSRPRRGVPGGRGPRARSAQRRRLTPGIASLLLLGAIAAIPLTAPKQPDESLYPKDAIAALRTSSGILVNELDWGGYLMWNVPERPVFIDGRLKPYQPDVIDEHLRLLLLRPRWREILEHYSVRQALLDPERPLAGALREDGWRVVLERNAYVLLERPE